MRRIFLMLFVVFVFAGQVRGAPYISPSTPDHYSERETEKYKEFLYYVRNGRMQEAEDSAAAIEDPEYKQASFAEIAMAYAKAGTFNKSEAYLSLVTDFEKLWTSTYYLIVEGYAAHGFAYKALHVADGLLKMMADQRESIYGTMFDGQKLYVDIAMSAAESGHYCCLSVVLYRISSFYYRTMAIENILLRTPRQEAEKFLGRMGYVRYNPTSNSLGQDMSERPNMVGQMNSISGDLVFYENNGLILIVKYGYEDGEKAFVVGHVYTDTQRKAWQESR